MKISTGSLKLTKYEFYANFFLTFCKWRKRSRHKFHNRAKYVDPCRHRQKIEISFRQSFPHLIISRKLGRLFHTKFNVISRFQASSIPWLHFENMKSCHMKPCHVTHVTLSTCNSVNTVNYSVKHKMNLVLNWAFKCC